MMNKPLKAALFSAFIFPGAGQILLKKYVSAGYFIAFASVGLYLLFSSLMARSQEIIDKIQSGEIAVDLTTIIALVHQQSITTTGPIRPALILLLVVWIVSVIEAYRVGNK